MQRKKVVLGFLIAILAVAFLASVVTAKQSVVKTMKKQEIYTHTIVPGDTLWDLSAHYYGDPWLWPKIWELNTYINDPHWIYPDNKLQIAMYEAYKVYMGMKQTDDFKPLNLFDPEFKYETQFNRIDLISPEKLQASGKIVDQIDDKILIGEEDTVYFTMGKDVNVQIGDIFTVFRVDRKVMHPIKKKKVGYMTNLVGEIKTVEANVLKSGKIVYTGQVIDSLSEMTVGDSLIPMKRYPMTVTVKESALDLTGYIITDLDQRTVLGDHDICFVDLGIKNGVMPGHSFSIYRRSKDEKNLPPYFIGNLIVLKVEDNNATALITNSLREIQVGDRIRSDITAVIE